MATDINLVIEGKPSPSKARLKKITTISFAVLFFTAFLSFLVFLLNLRFSANSIRSQQENLIRNISQDNQNSAKIILLNDRVKDVSAIVETRKKYNQTLSSIIDDLPASSTIEELKVAEDTVMFSVVSSSLLDLNEFLNRILAKASQKQDVSSVVLKTLTTTEGGFSMELEAKSI